MKLLKFIFGFVCVLAILPVLTAVIYLKVLPAAIQNPKVISYIEKIGSKALGADLKIEQPYLQTDWTPYARFKLKNVTLKNKDKQLLNVDNFDSEMSLWKLRTHKEIDIKTIKVDNIYADVSGIIDLPPFKKTSEGEKGLSINIFKSVAPFH